MDLHDNIAADGESVLGEWYQTDFTIHLSAGTQESQVRRLVTTCVAVNVGCVSRKDVTGGLVDIIVLAELADSDFEDIAGLGSCDVNCKAT
jgi:hypothetical protein